MEIRVHLIGFIVVEPIHTGLDVLFRAYSEDGATKWGYTHKYYDQI